MITPNGGRVFWLKITTALSFILGVALSPDLWTSSRFYPLTPVFSALPTLPPPFDWFLFLALMCSLIAVIIAPKPRPYIWVSVVTFFILACLDQQRLQPWAYQYAFMLAALGLFSWKENDAQGENAILNIGRFIVASIYFWSGIQKVNMIFTSEIFPWMAAPIIAVLPMWMQPLVYIFGFCVPFIEISIGLGLLTTRFRRLAIALAFAMCVFVLWTLGPFGHNWNSVVWPWNVAMVAFVLILFTDTRASLHDLVRISSNKFHALILLVFGILPLFYFFNLWDSYPSWSLYSGTTSEAIIYVSDDVGARLPMHIQNLVWTDWKEENVLEVSDWAFAELNTPPYPEIRIFKNLARSVCKIADEPNTVRLVVHGRLSWFYPSQEQVFNCTQM